MFSTVAHVQPMQTTDETVRTAFISSLRLYYQHYHKIPISVDFLKCANISPKYSFSGLLYVEDRFFDSLYYKTLKRFGTRYGTLALFN